MLEIGLQFLQRPRVAPIAVGTLRHPTRLVQDKSGENLVPLGIAAIKQHNDQVEPGQQRRRQGRVDAEKTIGGRAGGGEGGCRRQLAPPLPSPFPHTHRHRAGANEKQSRAGRGKPYKWHTRHSRLALGPRSPKALAGVVLALGIGGGQHRGSRVQLAY